MPDRQFVKYTFLKVDPAWRRLDAEERARHKREFIAACEDFGSERLLAGVLAGRHPRRRGPDAARAGHEPRPHPRAARRARPERAHALVRDAVLLPGDDQGVRVLRRVAPRGPPRALEVPVRLPVREDARVVPAPARRALARDAGAHQGRPRVPRDRPQHLLLVRARRPGVRGRVRDRRPGLVPGPRPAPADDRVLRVHEARHADVHVRVDVGRAGAERARRRGAAGLHPG